MIIHPRQTCSECSQNHAVMEFLTPGYEHNESHYLCQGCMREALEALTLWKDQGRGRVMLPHRKIPQALGRAASQGWARDWP